MASKILEPYEMVDQDQYYRLDQGEVRQMWFDVTMRTRKCTLTTTGQEGRTGETDEWKCL